MSEHKKNMKKYPKLLYEHSDNKIKGNAEQRQESRVKLKTQN